MKGASASELESYRRRLLLLALLLALLGAGLVGWAFTAPVGEWPSYLGAILLLGAWNLPSLYVDEVKERFLPLLAQRMGFRYRPEGLPWEAVAPSGLFRKPDRYESEDLVEGKVESIPFTSTDLALWEERRSGKGSYDVLIFKGTLYRFRLPFPAAGPVRVAPQGMGVQVGRVSPRFLALFLGLWYGFLLLFGYAVWSSGGWDAEVAPALVLVGLAPALFLLFYRLRRGRGLARVRLEGPEFEGLFDVYGGDQVGARKVLTPALMEALVEARRHLGRPFWAALEGKDLWVAIPGDRFRISPFRSLEGELARAGERWQEELSEAALLVEAFRLEEERARKGLIGKDRRGKDEGR